MSTITESKEYKGYKINIVYDEVCDSCRTWDNLGKIYSTWRDFNPDGERLDDLTDDNGNEYYKEDGHFDF